MAPSLRAARAAFFMILVVVAIGCDDTMTGPKPTPTPNGPTPTPGPPQSVAVGKNAQGQLTNGFFDSVSGTSTSTIHVGQTIQWNWLSGFHSTTSGTCPLGCVPNGLWDSGIVQNTSFQHTFPTAGTYTYFCSVHGTMMQGTVIVQ
jgi:plastocyanin